MTAKDFLKAVEAYYGTYERPLVKQTVLRYCEQFHADELRQIYQRLLLEFSGQYKVTPDIAAIEKVRRGYAEDRPDGVYRHGRRIGHMDGGRFIPDLSLLSAKGIKEYALGYQLYGDPQGYCRLLEEQGKRQLAITQKEKP